MEETTIIVETNHARRISLQEDWYNYHTDAIIYSFMVLAATPRIKPGDKKDGSQSFLYLSQAKFKKIRPWIVNVTGKNIRQINEKVKEMSGQKDQQYKQNNQQHLILKRYIHYDEDKKEYSFPYDYNERYYIVSSQVLAYLCIVSNPFIIKLYLYLADRYKYKQDWQFDLKQLNKVFGYSGSYNKKVNQFLKIGLAELKSKGLVDYSIIETPIKGNLKVDRFKLKKVSKQIPIQVKQNLNKLSLQDQNIIGLLK